MLVSGRVLYLYTVCCWPPKSNNKVPYFTMVLSSRLRRTMLRGVSYMAGGVTVLGVGQAAKLRWQYECPGGRRLSWRFGLKTPFLSFVCFFFARQHVNTYAK